MPVKSSGSWMTVFFLGFTFQVLITGYTAIVTTTLISQGTTEVKSFEEAIDKGYRICADTVIRPVLVEMYPQVAPLLVSVVSDDGYLMAMDRGECNAAILDADTWNSERMYGVTTHCENKVRLRETIAIIDNAMPVRPEILRPMSALVARNKERGLYAANTIEAKLNYTHNLCLESDLTTEKVEFGVHPSQNTLFEHPLTFVSHTPASQVYTILPRGCHLLASRFCLHRHSRSRWPHLLPACLVGLLGSGHTFLQPRRQEDRQNEGGTRHRWRRPCLGG